MLAIYNETATQWTGCKVNDKTVCLLKSKDYNRKGENVRRSVHLLMYNSIFNVAVDEILANLESKTGMSDLALLTDKDTTVIFSKKDYNPFMTERTSIHYKDVFLISIDLKGRKVLDISNHNVFLLESFILGGELSMIASLNNFEDTLDIKLFDDARKKIVVYTFGRDVNTNALYTKITVRDKIENEEELVFMPKRFRPAKVTYTIIVHSKDKEQLQKVVDTQNHNVIEVTKNTMDTAIQQLIDENYKAVTLFMNVESIDETAKKIYGALMTKLSTKFKVFYEMLNNGKIIKIKY